MTPRPALHVPEPLFPNAPKMRDEFREANPAAFGRAHGDTETIRRLAEIHARVSAVGEKLRAHIARHEPAWIAQEANRLLQKSGAHTLRLAPKNGARSVPPPTDLTWQARQTVRARITRRLSTLKETGKRMENAVAPPAPALKPAFKQALKQKGP